MVINAKRHPILWQLRPQFEDCVQSAQLSERRVLVGLSGGVDSSVAALVLQSLGYEVAGLFMKNWDEDDGTEYCTARQDLEDAQAVADHLGIQLHTANFAAEYWDHVFEHFLTSYQAGFTPNPDVLCNREIKFQVFKEYASQLGFKAIATGHYAINTPKGLFQSLDDNKDQTYFLNHVRREQLQQVVFPLGCVHKPDVRAIAQEAGLVTHRKKDSTGICFIGERRFKDFLSQYLPAQPGEIWCENQVIGEHQGLMYYTLGQRKGIGIGGLKNAVEKPWFVARKCLKRNRLYVVQDQYHPWLMSQTVEVDGMNWIRQPDAIKTLDWQGWARLRHRQPLAQVRIQSLSQNGNRITVHFNQPQWAVTPGQYLVLYDGKECLGGGAIAKTHEELPS